MPADLNITGFLLVLARLGSALVFVPMPGIRSAAAPAKVLLVLSLTLAMAPLWPRTATPLTLGSLLLWMSSELLFGLAAGVIVAFLGEVFTFAVQALSVQAGFSYATAIDPSSEADSGVLQIIAQLGANLLFFQCGGDRLVLRAFARSLEAWPPGEAPLGRPAAQALIELGARLLDLGLHLALPVIALLMLSDLTLALLGRLNAQLQLLSLAFPVKMLAALLMLAALTPLLPGLYRQALGLSNTAFTRLLTGGAN